MLSREALAIEGGQRPRGEHVVEVLNRLVGQRGAPKYLFADDGGNLPAASSICGPITMASGSTLPGPASLQIMPISRPSMGLPG